MTIVASIWSSTVLRTQLLAVGRLRVGAKPHGRDIRFLGPARVDVVRRSLTPTLSRGERELVLTDLLSHYLQYL